MFSCVSVDSVSDADYSPNPCKRERVSEAACTAEDATSVCVCHCACVCLDRHDERKIILCRLCLPMKHSCGHWSLIICSHGTGVYVSCLQARWFLQSFTAHIRVQTAHDTLYSFIQSFSHHLICQSHQIILYEEQLWHIWPWKACLQSLNIDPQGLSRGVSHECRKEGRKTDH